ncbi:hypothetical protein [Deinococcus misasensis]|uniref:hypothetical protein n=1 Tax=Deinococcus misasensis TaxID=392413 RepID=UPI00054FE280|nr:hypothetical protein [Deinococcus misasensis]
MPLATITQQNLTGPFTQTQLGDAIKTQLILAGWASVSDTAGSPRTLIHSRVFDAGKTYGTQYMIVRVPATTGSTFTQGLSWRANSADTQVSGENLPVWSTDATVYGVNHPEVSGFILRQGSQNALTLSLRPANNRPDWFDEANYTYGMAMIGGDSFINIVLPAQPTTIALNDPALMRAVSQINVTNPRRGNSYPVWERLGLSCREEFYGSFGTDVVTACYPTASITVAGTLTDGTRNWFVLGAGIAVRTL